LTAAGERISAAVPLSNIEIKRPVDGLPCISDYITTTISFIFSGSRLFREPLDLYVQCDPSTANAFLGIKKGFTRLKLDYDYDQL